jgi:hypothetical protein
VTLPFYAAGSYSLGAFLALRISGRLSRKLCSGSIIAVGAVFLLPLVVWIGMSVVLAVADWEQFVNVVRAQWMRTGFAWWGPLATVLDLSFPVLVAAYLIRSGIKMRRQVASP